MRLGAILLVFFSFATLNARLFAAQPPGWETAQDGRSGVFSYLGVGVANIDEEEARELNLSDAEGVCVTWVDEGSPAAKAGLQPRDILLQFNNQKIQSAEQLGRLVRDTAAGRNVQLNISRNGKSQNVAVVIGARKARFMPGPDDAFRMEAPSPPRIGPDMPNPTLSWQSAVLGIECEGIRSQFAEYFGVKQGVLVRSVTKDSAAEKAGLKAGDVIVKVGGKVVTSPREVTIALQTEGTPGKSTQLRLMRERKSILVNVTPEESLNPVIPWTRSVTIPERP